jgi:hypothetical protein
VEFGGAAEFAGLLGEGVAAESGGLLGDGVGVAAAAFPVAGVADAS